MIISFIAVLCERTIQSKTRTVEVFTERDRWSKFCHVVFNDSVHPRCVSVFALIIFIRDSCRSTLGPSIRFAARFCSVVSLGFLGRQLFLSTILRPYYLKGVSTFFLRRFLQDVRFITSPTMSVLGIHLCEMHNIDRYG